MMPFLNPSRSCGRIRQWGGISTCGCRSHLQADRLLDAIAKADHTEWRHGNMTDVPNLRFVSNPFLPCLRLRHETRIPSPFQVCFLRYYSNTKALLRDRRSCFISGKSRVRVQVSRRLTRLNFCGIFFEPLRQMAGGHFRSSLGHFFNLDPN
jgi:hypothetical protein